MIVLYFDKKYFRWAPLLIKSFMVHEPEEKIHAFGVNLKPNQLAELNSFSNVAAVEKIKIKHDPKISKELSYQIIERKARFLLESFRKFPDEELFILMDIDMLLVKPLTELKRSMKHYDMAGIIANEKKICGGFLAVRPTVISERLLADWDTFLMGDGEFYFNKDQPSLSRLYYKHRAELTFLNLPRTYLDHSSSGGAFIWSAHKTQFGDKDQRHQLYTEKLRQMWCALCWTVAIIPARGGSKGIEDKNLIDFCGKPLIAWSIEQTKSSMCVNEVFVFSDSEKILEVARDYGAIGLKEPSLYAGDTDPVDFALLYALDHFKSLLKADLVIFLQATSPLRSSNDIDGAILKLKKSGADSLFSASVLKDACIWTKHTGEFKGLTFNPDLRGTRLDREPLYLENGSIYVFRPEVLRMYGNRLGGKIDVFEMPLEKSYEIDDPEDIEICTRHFKEMTNAK